MDKTPAGPDSDTVREVIKSFLDERLNAKLDKLKAGDEQARDKLIDAYRVHNWVAGAVKRVGQIQQVTHALKFTHPDARGTNLTSHGNPAAGEHLLGTHTVGDSVRPDVVGNAAALDVYKFLKLEVDGKTLLQRAEASDSALAQALSDDPSQGREWMKALATLTEDKGVTASHTLAKQVYWPLEGGQYHLLVPLFPTSLIHTAWVAITEDRFSEEARQARQARRDNRPWHHGCREYPNLAVQKFGGSKPQNISQLNSERRGEAYLLPSLPPSWESINVKPPLNVETVFGNWLRRRPPVRRLLDNLKDFLHRTQAVNNVNIRRTREHMVSQLCSELIQFTDEIHQLPPGWTRDSRCRISLDEQCWLDPGRATEDKIFAEHVDTGKWRDEVCERFGNWLNARLSDSQIRMGEDEQREWRRELEKHLQGLRMELGHYD